MIMVTAATWGMHNDLLTACNGLTAVWCQYPVLIVTRNDHYTMMLHTGSCSYQVNYRFMKHCLYACMLSDASLTVPSFPDITSMSTT